MRFHIVLHQPRIPQNTGNIGRLCYASNAVLHLIYPIGFSITQKELKRAGMDYWEHLEVYEYANTEAFYTKHPDLSCETHAIPHFYLTTKATTPYYEAKMQGGAYLHFGREDAGLSAEILHTHARQCYTIPMENGARSLNLATSVGIVLYDGIRQSRILKQYV